MNVYLPIFLDSAWPVLLIFLAERALVAIFLRTDAQRARVRELPWLHPNAISQYRYPMGFLSVALFHYGYPRLAVWFFAFWMITDLTDGEIARRCGLSTTEGESIDPLSDKLMYGPALLYMAWRGQESGLGEHAWWGVGLFLAIDVIGQSLRFFIQRKAANLFGKAKTFLVVVLLVAAALELMYGTPARPLPHARMIPLLMWFCTAMAFCSVAFKIIPNYWYANILSILNLVCGLAGIVVILTGKSTIYAFGLVFLGQFLDLFDGRAAERWGSTPRGEIFDDVADGTSFGVTVGLIVYTSFHDWMLGAALGVAHFTATVYRLVRFVVEKRKAGVPGGVAWFSGLPSPAGALLTGSACLLLDSEPLRAAITLAASLLMVSRVPYPHFGRAVLPLVPKFFRVFILAGYTLVLVHAVRHDNYVWALASLFTVAVVYLLSPIFHRRPSPKAP